MNMRIFLLLTLLLCSVNLLEAKSVKPKKSEFPVNQAFSVGPDSVIQGEWKATAESPTRITSLYDSTSPRTWELKKDISAFPRFSAPESPLLTALYNLALEETLDNIRKEDGAFMAGKQWGGVWTRDISYSIHLSLALIHKEASIKSLQAKVNASEHIIQDTGTGGSWPVSTDRVVWAVAAWEIYLASGDMEFLAWAYRVIRNSAQRDLHIAWDPATRLFFGESSFLDWREQTYPIWMQPADIYESKALGTSALHYQTYRILSAMGRALQSAGKMSIPAEELAGWEKVGSELKESINQHFWLEEQQYYSAYLYPSLLGYLPSDKSESLGEALTVLFGIADAPRAQALIAHTPVVPFGIPCIYPQQAHTGPYHNKGIWPFVEAYYLWAAAATGNETASAFALRSIIRPAALFLTHKENLVFDTGHSKGTAINSDRQLWSVAGYLGSIYRVLFGIQLEGDSLYFRPVVPADVQGPLMLKNFPWRGAVLDITVRGQGSKVTSLKVNGVEKGAAYRLPSTAKGRQTILIQLQPAVEQGNIRLVSTEDIAPMEVKPDVEVSRSGQVTLEWKSSKKAVKYLIWKDNTLYQETTQSRWTEKINRFTVFTVQAVDEKGLLSPLSRPLVAYPAQKLLSIEAEKGSFDSSLLGDKYQGFSGRGYVESSKDPEKPLDLTLNIKQDGRYLLRVVYANGKGPINTDNKCAIRSLSVNGTDTTTLVLPQRGSWEWGYANPVVLSLAKGRHTLSFFYDEKDENMNQKVNYALIDRIELIQLD